MNQIVRVSPVAYPAHADSSLHEEIVELTQTHSARSYVAFNRHDEIEAETLWTLTASLADEPAEGGAE